MSKLLVVGCLILFTSAVFAEQVKVTRCEEQSNQQCTVSNVRITPCPEAADDLPCRIKKGKSVAIDFDLTPDFVVDSLHSQAYWVNGLMDLPLVGMDTDGCHATSCPIQPGSTSAYHWTLDVDKKFPTRQFNVKMKMKNQDENFCCFLFKIKLTK